jgi:hypothetical protein
MPAGSPWISSFSLSFFKKGFFAVFPRETAKVAQEKAKYRKRQQYGLQKTKKFLLYTQQGMLIRLLKPGRKVPALPAKNSSGWDTILS